MSTPRTLDFSRMDPIENRRQIREGLSMSPKQIRARIRRSAKAGRPLSREMATLYNKPVEEWDRAELAAGRPRDRRGGFGGKKPQWVNRAIMEEALERFAYLVRTDVRQEAAGALDIVHELMTSDEVDDRGKPLVSAAVKLDAAKWLTEHIIGKPTQRIEGDISVKLQAVLAQAMAPAGMLPAAPVEQIVGPRADPSVWELDGEEIEDE